MNKFTHIFLTNVGAPSATINLLQDCWDEPPLHMGSQCTIGTLVSAIISTWHSNVDSSKLALNVILDTLPKVSILKDIKVSIKTPPYPWAVFAYGLDEESLKVACTVGLTKFIHAELLIIHSLDMSTVCAILNRMAQGCMPSQINFNEVPNLLPGTNIKAKLLEVNILAAEAYVDVHKLLFKGATRKYYQVMLSDEDGVFPNEDNYKSEYDQLLIE